MEKYLKNKKINIGFKEDIEPQEVLLDSLAQKKEEEFGISEKKFEVPLLTKTVWILYAVFLIFILVLFYKTIDLQVRNYAKFSTLAEGNKTINYPIRTTRGVIYDRSGKQIVFNQPSFDLVFYKKEPISRENKIKSLNETAKILSEDAGELRKKIDSANEAKVLIRENVTPEILMVLEAKIISNQLSGFQIERNAVRDYKDSLILSHLIGYTGKIDPEEYKSVSGDYSVTDYIGKTGVEKAYEKVLAGKTGTLRIEVDALGNKISEAVVSEPQPGKSLVLWLDSDLQKKIKEELDSTLKTIGSHEAAVVAMNPRSGGVLAMVSVPSFDNNLFSKGNDPEAIKKLLNSPDHPLFNRVISGTYPSGSTVKPLIASAALEEKLISPNKEIYDPGYILVPNPWNPDNPTKFSDWMAHGSVNLRKAIAVSCNVYFYTIGGGFGGQQGLGPSRIKKYLELFGWGNKTNIDLPGEQSGLVPDPGWKKEHFENTFDKTWRDGDTYNLSIGQGYLLITPLQVVTAFSAIANGGKLLKPQTVKEIIDTFMSPETSDGGETLGKTIKSFQPETVRENFISSQNLQIVREGMREAVISGSSVILSSLPIKAAAKTGTAQSSRPGYYYNWVTVFAPYDDPQIVLTVVIENVKDVQVAALPIAKNVLEWYFTPLESLVPPGR